MERANRPRPRPKPKPKAKAENLGPSETPEPGSSRSTPEPQPDLVRDEDEHFVRNRKRTTAAWHKLRSIDIKNNMEMVDDDIDEEQPWRKKKKTLNPQPKWQRMLSEKLSDKSDDDILEVQDGPSPVKQAKGKERSRSRSVTPPPSVPIQEIQRARNLVRQALALPIRPPSPELLDADISIETIVLDSELASLVKAAELQADPRSIASERDVVKIIVRWQSHPKDTSGAAERSGYTMNRDESFHALFEAVADEYETLTQNLVLTYKGKRLYSSASPRALNIWTEAEFVACNTETYNYLRLRNQAEGSQQSPTIPPPPASRTPSGSSKPDTLEIDSDSDDIVLVDTQPVYNIKPTQAKIQPRGPSRARDSDAESEADSDKFKIVLQSSVTQGKNMTLTVRPTTKCSAIVKAFLKKAGLEDQYPEVYNNTAGRVPPRGKSRKHQVPKDPKICVDGEKLSNDTAIGNADLEDGDMVEVVGL